MAGTFGMDVITPIVLTELESLVTDGLVGAVRYGEQFSVAQPPELWVTHASGTFPELQGSERERSDWVYSLELLYPWENDQANAERQLRALVEPVRDVFRRHLHLGRPDIIARARVLTATWGWSVKNIDIYRNITFRLAVREKVSIRFNS